MSALEPLLPIRYPAQVGPYRVDGRDLLVIAGPCVIESEALCLEVAEALKGITTQLRLPFVFKASFDKANRTALDSFRGPGLAKGLEVLAKVREQVGVPVTTDVHEPSQVKPVAEVVDLVQIPAFLCRQTDLLVEAGRWAKAVNLKKGQFADADTMAYAAQKVMAGGCQNILLTERGNFFGYGDLVVDMRNLLWLRQAGHPVLFDATHSVQQPGGRGKASGGGDGSWCRYCCALLSLQVWTASSWKSIPIPTRRFRTDLTWCPCRSSGSCWRWRKSCTKSPESFAARRQGMTHNKRLRLALPRG